MCNSAGWSGPVKTLPRLWAVGLLSCVILATGGCATSGLGNNSMEPGPASHDLFWPSPPQPPRIRYVGSISSSSDVGVKESWLRKTLGRVFGEKESDTKMLRPYGVYADSERIYVTDPGISVLHIFDMKEKKYFYYRWDQERRIYIANRRCC